MIRPPRLSFAKAWCGVTVRAVTTLLVVIVSLHGASAYTSKTLHSFCAWADCHDGLYPYDRLLLTQSGVLYGTVNGGGRYGEGVAFKLTYNPDTGKWKEAVIHNFCAKANCSDGAFPETDLISDVDGNFYGTTYLGGRNGSDGIGGVVFKLTHKADGWGLTVLHSFCGENHCADGHLPINGLSYAGQASGAPWDEFSPLFGTTAKGGAYDNGVAYELTSDGSLWNYTVIHNFNGSNTPNALLVDNAGNLFGTTQAGGKYGGGLMYKLANGTWKETALHYFCNVANCADGNSPRKRLLMDATGNLFGVTAYGGANCTHDGGCGVVFERTAGGAYSVLYNFCSVSQCLDGSTPEALLMDSSGNLFGPTYFGGSNGSGTVFELKKKGALWEEVVLYSLCSQAGCGDGANGISLLLDGSGDLFGAAAQGGAHDGDGICEFGCGTVFELTP